MGRNLPTQIGRATTSAIHAGAQAALRAELERLVADHPDVDRGGAWAEVLRGAYLLVAQELGGPMPDYACARCQEADGEAEAEFHVELARGTPTNGTPPNGEHR